MNFFQNGYKFCSQKVLPRNSYIKYLSTLFSLHFPDYLQTQFSGLAVRPNLTMTSWTPKIYQSIIYSSLSGSILECVLDCIFLDGNNCNFFIFENNICYKARTNYTNGTVQEIYSTSTMYCKQGKYLLMFFKLAKACTIIMVKNDFS